MNARLTLAAIALVTVLALAGAVVLAALGRPVPDQLWTVATAGLAALGGAMIPFSRSSSDDDPTDWDSHVDEATEVATLTRKPRGRVDMSTPVTKFRPLAATRGGHRRTKPDKTGRPMIETKTVTLPHTAQVGA